MAKGARQLQPALANPLAAEKSAVYCRRNGAMGIAGKESVRSTAAGVRNAAVRKQRCLTVVTSTGNDSSNHSGKQDQRCRARTVREGVVLAEHGA